MLVGAYQDLQQVAVKGLQAVDKQERQLEAKVYGTWRETLQIYQLWASAQLPTSDSAGHAIATLTNIAKSAQQDNKWLAQSGESGTGQPQGNCPLNSMLTSYCLPTFGQRWPRPFSPQRTTMKHKSVQIVRFEFQKKKTPCFSHAFQFSILAFFLSFNFYISELLNYSSRRQCL